MRRLPAGAGWQLASSALPPWLSLPLWLSLAACAPALNWRDVRPEQAEGLRATFPCKPDVAERQLRLPGLAEPVTVRLLSCQTDGRTWALSHLTVADADQVAVALRALAAATRGNLEAASAGGRAAVQATELPPVTVPGMTPQPDSRAWRFDTRPAGPKAGSPGEAGASSAPPTTVTAWHFSHGLTVFQASVWQREAGTTAHSGPQAIVTFAQGFHFPG